MQSVFSHLTNSMSTPSANVFSFHRPLSYPYNSQQLKSCLGSSRERSAISKVNKHKFSLLALGILPNQLRNLLRHHMGRCESVLSDLQSICFWGGYQIWQLRKAKMKQVWESLKPPKLKQKRKKNGENVSACKNPFHFLTKFADFSHQRITRCPCSLVETKKRKSACLDIRSLLLQQSSNDCSLDLKHANPSISLPSSKSCLTSSAKKACLVRISQFKPP